MGVNISLEWKNLAKQIVRLSQFDQIWTDEMEKAGRSGGVLLRRDWQKESPVRLVGGGAYRRSIGYEVESLVGTSVTTIVGTNVVSEAGFPYPKHLEEATGWHYASGPRQGQALKGRVKAILTRNKEKLTGYVQKAGDRIMRRLGVR